MFGNHTGCGRLWHWTAAGTLPAACLAVYWAGCSVAKPGADAGSPMRAAGLSAPIAEKAPQPATHRPAPPPALDSNTHGHLHGQGPGVTNLNTVFHIVMAGRNWQNIHGNVNAVYINNTLLPMASRAEQYHTHANAHGKLTNRLWMHAGQHFNILDEGPPGAHHVNTNAHLVAHLKANGKTWRSYHESMIPGTCPLASAGLFPVNYCPVVYFDDVNGNLNPYASDCIANVRSLAQLAADLAAGDVGDYNFITPNLCHDTVAAFPCVSLNPIADGDAWLAAVVTLIMGSASYAQSCIFITWDDAEWNNGPIGMIAVSPFAKGGGYFNTIFYTHSSLLRSLQIIFGTSPWLGDAANANDLSDLFTVFP